MSEPLLETHHASLLWPRSRPPLDPGRSWLSSPGDRRRNTSWAHQLLHGSIVAVCQYAQPLRQNILEYCRSLGAEVRENGYASDVTHLICHYKSGEDYYKAIADGKFVATVYWLDDCARARCCLPLEEKPALYVPFVRRDGVPGMERCVISVTGFSGTERADVKAMVLAAGAKYTGDLSKQHNTHLVACRTDGQKYFKAREWGGIHIVSREWVEDCLMNWQRMPEDLEMYRNVEGSAIGR